MSSSYHFVYLFLIQTMWFWLLKSYLSNVSENRSYATYLVHINLVPGPRFHLARMAEWRLGLPYFYLNQALHVFTFVLLFNLLILKAYFCFYAYIEHRFRFYIEFYLFACFTIV